VKTASAILVFLLGICLAVLLAACGGDEESTSAADRIAFMSVRDANLEIYVMNADGSGQTRLTDHPDEDAGPAWSP
jgi:TolB protein